MSSATAFVNQNVPPRLRLADADQVSVALPPKWRGGKPNLAYFYGDNGTGKTMAAVVTAREWIFEMPLNTTFKFLSAREVARRYTDREEWETEDDVSRELRDVTVMILDDIDEVCGKEYGTPKLAYIRELISLRVDYMRHTIITGNRKPFDWGDVDTAIQSRLLGCDLVEFKGEDRRLA